MGMVRKSCAGFRLDSRSAVFKGGDLGPAILQNEPDQSRLLRAIRYEDDDLEMPPAGKLPADEIAILTHWVKEGVLVARALRRLRACRRPTGWSVRGGRKGAATCHTMAGHCTQSAGHRCRS